MKINYLKMSAFAVLAASTLFLGSCSKDEDSNDNPGGGAQTENYDQNSVLFSFTGNWCGPCGQYGKPAITNLSNAKKDRAIVLSCQLNSSGTKDPLNSQEANVLAGAFGITGIPTIYVAGIEQPMVKMSANASLESNLNNKVSEINASKPTVYPVIKKTISGNTLTVNVETKFLQDVSGEYYIAAYIVEDKVVGNQYVNGSGWVNNTEFNNVVRKGLEIGTNGFGQLVTSGSVKVGQSFKKDYTVTLDPSWKSENVKVAVIISKKTDGKFTVSNGAVK